jgi:NADH dehydrogenase FAD-containing subunit
MSQSDFVDIPENRSAQESSMHRVLIVGGGAGGLELATRLGDSLGKREKASISLLDKTRTHVWKPHLHEVASGTLDVDVDSVEYLAHARARITTVFASALCAASIATSARSTSRPRPMTTVAR